MSLDRPLLVCSLLREGRGPGPSSHRGEAWPYWSPPHRVVLRAAEVVSSGPTVAYQLCRASTLKQARPRLIALELDPSVPLGFAIAALLLLHTDPTPETARLLWRLELHPPSRAGTKDLSLRALRERDLRGQYLERLETIAARRGSPRLWLAILTAVATYPPRHVTQHRIARRLAERVSKAAAKGSAAWAPLVPKILAAFAGGPPPPITGYRAFGRHLPAQERMVIAALMASAWAASTSVGQLQPSIKLRAALRAEAKCRAAGLRSLSGVARSYRRRIHRTLYPQALDRVLLRCLRVVTLAGARGALWNAASDQTSRALDAGHLSRSRASLATHLLVTRGQGFTIHPSRIVRLRIGKDPRSSTRKVPRETRDHLENMSLMERNQLRRAERRLHSMPAMDKSTLYALSLGAMGKPHETGIRPRDCSAHTHSRLALGEGETRSLLGRLDLQWAQRAGWLSLTLCARMCGREAFSVDVSEDTSGLTSQANSHGPAESYLE